MSTNGTLPRFEGQQVAGARLIINGIGEDLHEALKNGEDVFLCLQVKVNEIGHKVEAKGQTITRVHKAAIVRTGRMDPNVAGQLLDAEQERRQKEADEREGKSRLPMGGDDTE